jgi:hypothetical protein
LFVVELAFRPASKLFVFDPEPALAGSSNCALGFFSSLRHAVKRREHVGFSPLREFPLPRKVKSGCAILPHFPEN